MTTKRARRRRSLTERVIASGVLQELAPDLAIVVALVLIGVGVYRLSTDLVWVYAGLVVLVPALIVTSQRAAKRSQKPE